jgi:hypothetical protein
MFTIRGASDFLRAGSAARTVRGLEAVAIDGRRDRDPGVVDQDVDAAEVLHELREDALDGDRIGEVERPTPHVRARRLQLRDDPLELRLVDVDGGNPSPFIGEQLRRGATHAARCTGHDRYLAFNRTRQLGQPRHSSHPSVSPPPYIIHAGPSRGRAAR